MAEAALTRRARCAYTQHVLVQVRLKVVRPGATSQPICPEPTITPPCSLLLRVSSLSFQLRDSSTPAAAHARSPKLHASCVLCPAAS